jgi:predicted CopG family antitoxin
MNRVVKIDAKDYSAYLRNIATAEIPKAIERGCLSGALRCIPIVQRSTETAPPANPAGKGVGGAFNYGDYKRAWKATPTKGGAAVFNDRLYAAVIEEGRRAGAKMPPSDPDVIAHWVQRHLGKSKKEAKQLSFVIRRAIKARGLNPRRVLARAIPEMDKAVDEEIIRELEAAY